ncbi:MAG: hypothetical protein WAM62_04020 [Pseudolabrys sp.]|jgi:hypothetical protein
MLGKMARATFLLMLAVMVVAWAVSLGKTDTSAQQDDQLTETWTIYS